jgi:hypothetical protein
MSKEDKTRELYMNLKYAYDKFHKAISEYITTAEYPIDIQLDDLGRVVSATINISDGWLNMSLKDNHWSINIPDNSPINPDNIKPLVTKWLDDRIRCCSNQLNRLVEERHNINK